MLSRNHFRNNSVQQSPHSNAARAGARGFFDSMTTRARPLTNPTKQECVQKRVQFRGRWFGRDFHPNRPFHRRLKPGEKLKWRR
jgi:hypothetical protein